MFILNKDFILGSVNCSIQCWIIVCAVGVELGSSGSSLVVFSPSLDTIPKFSLEIIGVGQGGRRGGEI